MGRIDQILTEANRLSADLRRGRDSFGFWAYTPEQKKAEKLLLSMLSPAQRESYRRSARFTVIGSAGNHYRIECGHINNITWVSRSGIVLGVFCAHPRRWEPATLGRLPDQDVMLGQMLTLVDDEWALLRKANKAYGQWPSCKKNPWDAFWRRLCKIATFPL